MTRRVPRVLVLDARTSSLDPAGLRRWARELSARCPAGCWSRSYRYPLALVAWHDREVGVDIERVGYCDQAFADLVCSPEEWAVLDQVGERDHFLTSLWSSKEALAKLLGDPVGYVPRELVSPLLWGDDPRRAIRASAVPVPAGHVGWVCWRGGEPTGSPLEGAGDEGRVSTPSTGTEPLGVPATSPRRPDSRGAPAGRR